MLYVQYFHWILEYRVPKVPETLIKTQDDDFYFVFKKKKILLVYLLDFVTLKSASRQEDMLR